MLRAKVRKLIAKFILERIESNYSIFFTSEFAKIHSLPSDCFRYVPRSLFTQQGSEKAKDREGKHYPVFKSKLATSSSDKDWLTVLHLCFDLELIERWMKLYTDHSKVVKPAFKRFRRLRMKMLEQSFTNARIWVRNLTSESPEKRARLLRVECETFLSVLDVWHNK